MAQPAVNDAASSAQHASEKPDVARSINGLKNIPTGPRAMRQHSNDLSRETGGLLAAVEQQEPKMSGHARKAPFDTLQEPAAIFVPKPNDASTRDVTSQSVSYSSPVRVSLRAERDDAASSISGRSASDLSSHHSNKCHVCKVQADLTTLVKCTSCSRRYHRHCHQQQDIPVELAEGWQCQRCVRKKIPLKRRFQDSMTDLEEHHAGVVSKPQTINHAVQDGAEPVSVAQEAALVGLSPRSSVEPSLTKQDLGTATAEQDIEVEDQPEDRRYHIMHPQPSPTLPLSDDSQFLEAQDLVEKSFVASPSNSDASKKITKPLFVKRKSFATTPSETAETSGPAHVSTEVDVNRSRNISDANRMTAASGDSVKNKSEEATMQEDNRSCSPSFRAESTTSAQSTMQRNRDDLSTRSSTEPQLMGESKAKQAKPSLLSHARKPPRPSMVWCEDCTKRKIVKRPSGRTLCSSCRAAARLSTEREPIGMQPADEASNDLDFPEVQSELPTAAAALSRATALAEKAITAESAANIQEDTKMVEEADADRLAMGENYIDPEGGASNVCAPDGDSLTEQLSEPSKTQSSKSVTAADTHQNSSALVQQQDLAAGHEGTPFDPETDDQLSNHDSTKSECTVSPHEDVNHIARGLRTAKSGKTRQCQRRAAIDEFDLGDAFHRPKSTYARLIALAFVDTPGHRLQPKNVVQWVADHVPGYSDIKAGIWAESLKATLIHNRKDVTGKAVIKIVDEQQQDSGDGGGMWYELLPGVKDRLERWDHNRKRPGPPTRTTSHSPAHSTRRGSADLSDARSPRSKGRFHERPGLATASTDSPSRRRSTPSLQPDISPNDHMDVDSPSNQLIETARNEDSSDEEPLAVVRKLPRFVPPAPMMVSSAASPHETTMDAHATEQRIAECSDFMDDATLQEDILAQTRNSLVATEERRGLQKEYRDAATSSATSRAHNATCPESAGDLRTSVHRSNMSDPNDGLLWELIRQETEQSQGSNKTLLSQWPEFHPSHRFDRRAKIEEIKARPTRKQRYNNKKGRMHAGLTFHIGVDAPPVTVSPQKRTTAHDDGHADGTFSKPCNTLDEFLGITETLVPVIVDKQLAFRSKDPRSRSVYKTGI